MARPTAQIAAARLRPKLAKRYAERVDGYFRGFERRLVPAIEPKLGSLVERFAVKADVSTELDQAVALLLRTFGWDAESRTFLSTVTPVADLVGASAADAVGTELGLDASYDLFARPLVLSDTATRVVGIADTSRDALRRLIGDGISKGLSVEQIVGGVAPGTSSVRGEIPAFDGIRGLVDSWLSTGTGRILGGGTSPTSSRSYLIALTETASTWNVSALASYKGLGVGFVEVFDGPSCGWTSHNDPDLATGSIRSVAAANAQPLSHPRCQRAFGAAVTAKGPRAAAGPPKTPAGPFRDFASRDEAAAFFDQAMPAARDLPFGATRGSVAKYGLDGYEPANGLARLGEAAYRAQAVGGAITDPFDASITTQVRLGEEVTKAMDATMSPLPVGTTLHRAVWDADAFSSVLPISPSPVISDRLAELPKLVGQVVEDKGFLSTSVGPDVAEGYVSLPIRLHLTTPAGTEAVWLRPLAPGTFQREYELVLARGTRYVVTSVEKRVESISGILSDVWHVYGTVLP